jgi:deazaflavin-dependent oxidoreductase (nitroreductase family)
MAAAQRKMMRFAMGINIWLYRKSKGRVMGSVRGLPVLLLTAPGRKTGTPHTAPVSYLRDADRYVVTGSAGGQPAEPQWFRNLRATERADVEVGNERITVAVRIATPDEHATLWAQLVAKAPFFATYQTKVQRQIPMAILTPSPPVQ